MNKTFDYLYVLQATGSFEIEDIGKFSISCTNDAYYEYIMIVETVYGISHIIQAGPIPIDRDEDLLFRSMSYSAMPFDGDKISKMVEKLINDTKKMITQVTRLDKDDALERVPDLKELFVNATKREC